jgi:hypothetical protein
VETVTTLENTLNLLRESLSDASHYAEQVELILKEKNRRKEHREHKEERKEKAGKKIRS